MIRGATIKVLTQAQKQQQISELYKLPEQVLPSTLKYNLQLPNIKKIAINYRDQCKDIGVAFQFFRKYVADIRYHNPNIIVQRNRTKDGPIKVQFVVELLEKHPNYEEKEVILDATDFKSTGDLRQLIERLGNLQTQNKVYEL